MTVVGLVHCNKESEVTEFDAWVTFGVDNVVDRIEMLESSRS